MSRDIRKPKPSDLFYHSTIIVVSTVGGGGVGAAAPVAWDRWHRLIPPWGRWSSHSPNGLPFGAQRLPNSRQAILPYSHELACSLWEPLDLFNCLVVTGYGCLFPLWKAGARWNYLSLPSVIRSLVILVDFHRIAGTISRTRVLDPTGWN